MFRSSWIEINLDALKHNLESAQKQTTKEIICVIKANAYGAGDEQVVKTALSCGIKTFAVSSLDEALILRNKGIQEKIIILGFVHPEHIPLCLANNLTCTCSSLEWLYQLSDKNPHGLLVHLKIDTGMNRLGVKGLEEAKEALTLCKEYGLQLEGVFTHFSSSNIPTQETTRRQYNEFVSIVEQLNHSFKYIHTCNSDAIFSFEDAISNAVRLGISMFGISSYRNDLKPVFALYTTLSLVKQIHSGEAVSYGETYVAQTDEVIATIPIGYADGWCRRNQGRLVFVEDSLAEVIGSICMDQSIIRLPRRLPLGTKVELFGNNIAIETVAKELQTIPYEIITTLSERLPRLYISNGQVIDEVNARLDYSKQKKA